MGSPTYITVQSMTLSPGGTSQKVALSTTSAQSTAIPACPYIVVTADVACFIRKGAPGSSATVTAVADTDQYLPAGVAYRFPWDEEKATKLAIVAVTGTGNAWITPGV